MLAKTGIICTCSQFFDFKFLYSLKYLTRPAFHRIRNRWRCICKFGDFRRSSKMNVKNQLLPHTTNFLMLTSHHSVLTLCNVIKSTEIINFGIIAWIVTYMRKYYIFSYTKHQIKTKLTISNIPTIKKYN